MRATVLSLLVLAAAAAAGPRVVGDHEVKPGGFAALRAEGAGKTVLWTVTPAPVQDAEFAGVLVFTGVPGQQYQATAIIIDFEAKTAEKLRHTVVFAGPTPPPTPPGPQPGPGPTPPPTPDPPRPADLPIPGDGLRMLVVWETADLSTYPAGQVQAMTDADVRDYLRRKCPKGPDGRTPEFRVYDKDADLAGEAPTWRLAFARAKRAGQLPRLLIANGKDGYEGALPASAAELLALLKRYGGE